MMKPRYCCYFAACTAVIIGWGIYALARYRIAIAIAGRFGALLLNWGQGKIQNTVSFVEHRFGETLWLGTLALLLVAAQWLFNRITHARMPRYQWTAQGIGAFVLLNIGVGAAMNTVLFWGAMGVGAGVQNLLQFHFKRILAEENPVTDRAILLGSSQTRAEIDENVLNELLGTSLWTTELHFPGSHAYDLLLIERQLRHINPQIVICYLSEGYFYTGSHGETPPNFLGFGDVLDGIHRGVHHYLSRDEILSGLLGDLIPVFRCREVLASRVLGSTILGLRQEQYDASLQSDLDVRAKQVASEFHRDMESEFQKRALDDFVAHCQRAKRRVILVAGGYNPILECRIDPALRADMLSFLNQLQSRYSTLTIVAGADLLEQTVDDYDDLSHVNRDTQRRFTTSLAKFLADFLAGKTAKH